MKFDSLIADSFKTFGARFTLVGLLPSGLLCLFVLALIWSGAPERSPDLARVVQRATNLSPMEIAALAVSVLLLALVLQPLQLSLVRILEGYWGDSWLADKMSVAFIHLQCRRRRKLVAATQALIQADRDQKRRMATAAWLLHRNYPPEDKLLPTRLGNVLRSAEDRASRRYGLDSVVVWPRLYPLISEKLATILSDQRNALDLSARGCVMFLLAAVAGTVLLFRHGAWLTVPGSALVLAWLSYRSAIGAAVAYGESIETAFDLYRFNLLKTLHFPFPTDHETERAANRQLSDFLRQGIPVNFAYVHVANADKEPSEGETKTHSDAS